MAERAENSARPERLSAEELLEQVRSDPRVIVRRRDPNKPIEPFVSEIRVVSDIDILDLLGRRDDEEEDER